MKYVFSKIITKVKIYFDKLRGLDVILTVEAEEYGYSSDKVYHSSPSGNKYLKKVLDNLNITDKDSFIDIGSGKGSVLICATNYPFKEIGGIELSKQLVDISLKNFKILKLKNINIDCVDAISFKKYDAYNIFYMYNPFPSSIMKKVIQNIEKKHMNSEHEIILIYNNPTCHNDIVQNNFFLDIAEYKAIDDKKIIIYSNKNRESSRLC